MTAPLVECPRVSLSSPSLVSSFPLLYFLALSSYLHFPPFLFSRLRSSLLSSSPSFPVLSCSITPSLFLFSPLLPLFLPSRLLFLLLDLSSPDENPPISSGPTSSPLLFYSVLFSPVFASLLLLYLSLPLILTELSCYIYPTGLLIGRSVWLHVVRLLTAVLR